jgi:hypothetical protein
VSERVRLQAAVSECVRRQALVSERANGVAARRRMRFEGRHLSAEQLQFLKEAYSKDAPVERGGHTLDLLDSLKLAPFEGVSAKAFAAKHKRDLALVEQRLQDQKGEFTDGFVEGERARLQARRGAAAKALLQPETQAESPKARYQALARELREVEATLEGVASSSSAAVAVAVGTAERAPQRAHRSAHERQAAARRRGMAQSLLVKKAIAMTPAQQRSIHLASKYTSSLSKDFTKEFAEVDISDTSHVKHRISGNKMTKYADSRAKSPDLRGL